MLFPSTYLYVFGHQETSSYIIILVNPLIIFLWFVYHPIIKFIILFLISNWLPPLYFSQSF